MHLKFSLISQIITHLTNNLSILKVSIHPIVNVILPLPKGSFKPNQSNSYLEGHPNAPYVSMMKITHVWLLWEAMGRCSSHASAWCRTLWHTFMRLIFNEWIPSPINPLKTTDKWLPILTINLYQWAPLKLKPLSRWFLHCDRCSFTCSVLESITVEAVMAFIFDIYACIAISLLSRPLGGVVVSATHGNMCNWFKSQCSIKGCGVWGVLWTPLPSASSLNSLNISWLSLLMNLTHANNGRFWTISSNRVIIDTW